MEIFKDLENYDNLKELFDDYGLLWQIPQKEINTFYVATQIVLRNIMEKIFNGDENE